MSLQRTWVDYILFAFLDDPAETLDNLKLRHDELVKELESEKLRHASKECKEVVLYGVIAKVLS